MSWEMYEAAKKIADGWYSELVATRMRNAVLGRDNAKLRELVSVMAYCNQFERDCDGCSMNGAAGIITECAGCDELLALMRELGVEVGDANPTQEESSGKCNPSSCNCSNDCTNSERIGTCYDTGESRIFHCSKCGLGLDDVFIDDEERYPFADFPQFCPFCGAKVVEPTTNDVDAEVDA